MSQDQIELEIKGTRKTNMGEFPDDVLDTVDVKRNIPIGTGLANEPITVIALISAGAVGMLSITRLAERWMITKDEAQRATFVLEADSRSPDARAAMERLNSEFMLSRSNPSRLIRPTL